MTLYTKQHSNRVYYFPFHLFFVLLFFLYASTNVKKIRASGLSQTLSCLKNIQLNSLVTSGILPMSYTTLLTIPTKLKGPQPLHVCSVHWRSTGRELLTVPVGIGGPIRRGADGRLGVTCTIRDCTHVFI